jgi:hypothetical protein
MTESIRIRVGASVDRNIGTAFRPIVDAARVARQAVEDEMARAWAAVRGEGSAVGGGAGRGGPYRSVVREAEKAANQIVETERRKQARIAAEEARAMRRRETAERHVARIKDRYFAEQQRQGERAEKLAAQEAAASRKAAGGRMRAIGSGSLETMGKIGRGALGVAGTVARGAGVQTDLAAYVGQAVELETRATELSNAAYDEQRDKGKRLDPSQLVRLGRQVGQQAAFDPARVLEGLQSFVGKTGDLATGQAALPGLAKLARATGTSLEDMIGSAGEASKALGEVGPGKAFETAEEKGKALVNVLRLIAGQGKVGAVELKDLAKYGGRLSAASTAFGGNAAQNLGDMGALAQLAVAKGGAASAAEAATSVAGFANTLKTPARVKEFKAHGVDIMAKGGGFKSVRDILKDASAAAVERGGTEAPLEFKKMFANVYGARAADPAMQAYSKAFQENLGVTKDKTKADKAGREAVDALFDNFGKAISAAEEQESFDKSMKTGAAQVQLFNNELSKIGGQIAEKVLPALIKAGPTIIKFVEKFASFVNFAVDNPGQAAAGALAASIAKASIGNVVSGGLDKLISGAAASPGAMKGLGVLSIAATAITIGAVGKMIIDSVMDSKDKGVNASIEADARAFNARQALQGAVTTQNAGQAQLAYDNAKKEKAALEQRIQAAQDPTSFFGALFGSKTFEQRERETQDAAKIEDLKADLAKLNAAMDKVGGILKGGLNVNVQNMPAGPGPIANTANTTK